MATLDQVKDWISISPKLRKGLQQLSHWTRTHKIVLAINFFSLAVLVASFQAYNKLQRELRSEPSVSITFANDPSHVFAPLGKRMGWRIVAKVESDKTLKNARAYLKEFIRVRDKTVLFRAKARLAFFRVSEGACLDDPFMLQTERILLLKTDDAETALSVFSCNTHGELEVLFALPKDEYEMTIALTAENLRREQEMTYRFSWAGDMKSFSMRPHSNKSP